MRLGAWLSLTLLACRPPAALPVDEAVTLRIVAMNDYHGGLYEEGVSGVPDVVLGGLPWLAGAVDALRAEDPHLLLIDGGDFYQGAWPVNATKGRGSVASLNLLGVDAAAVGNHEFDYGGVEGGHPLRGALEAGAKTSNFPWLTANIRTAEGERWQPEGVTPWVMLERKGKKIAVIGLTTTDTPQTTLLVNVADLTFQDVVAAVDEILPEVRAAKPDVMVLAAHLTGKCAPASYLEVGEPCTPDGEIGRLLNELPPGTFDVMILGHAHTLLAHRVGDTYLLENRARGHALGMIDLVVGPNGVEHDRTVLHAPWGLTHEPVDPGCGEGEFDLSPRALGGRTVTPRADALALVRQLEEEVGSLCTEVGCAARPLGRDRAAESEVGVLVADAIAWALPEADLAIQNSGGLRADLPGGTLRRGDLQQVMPFDNRLYVVEMTGEQVALMFRLGASGAHGILQVAGARYHFDPQLSTGTDLDGDGEVAQWEHDRLCSVEVGGAPLDPKATYKVATTDFLLGGGDHLGPAFEGVKIVKEGPLLREVLFDYPATLGACIGAAGSLVDPDAPRIRQGACE